MTRRNNEVEEIVPFEQFIEYITANSMEEFWNQKAYFESDDTNPPAR